MRFPEHRGKGVLQRSGQDRPNRNAARPRQQSARGGVEAVRGATSSAAKEEYGLRLLGAHSRSDGRHHRRAEEGICGERTPAPIKLSTRTSSFLPLVRYPTGEPTYVKSARFGLQWHAFENLSMVVGEHSSHPPTSQER